MKSTLNRKRLVVASLLSLAAAGAQAQIFLYVSPGNGFPSTMAVDPLGNAYTGGNFSNTLNIDATPVNSNGGNDAWLAKYDAAGNVLWKTTMGGTGSETLSKVTTDDSGNVYAAVSYSAQFTWGGASYTPVSGTDVLLMKLDGNGNPVWAKSLGSAGTDAVYYLGIDGSKNLHVVSTTNDQNYSVGNVSYPCGLGENINHITLAPDGSVVRAKNVAAYNESIPFQPNAAQIDAAGNLYFGCFASQSTVIIGGNSYNPTYATGHFFTKIDTAGNMVWHKQFNYNGGPSEAIAIDAGGNITYTGDWDTYADFGDTSFTQNGAASDDAFILHYDNNGNYQWGQSWGSLTGNESAPYCQLNAQGEIVIAGYAEGQMTVGNYSISPNGGDFYVAVLDNNGNVLRTMTANSPGEDRPTCMGLDGGHHIVLGGYTSSGGAFGGYSFNTPLFSFVTSIDDDACQITGRTYKDYNSNASIDGIDAGLGDVVVQAMPGNYYSISGQPGNYQLLTLPGTYTLSVPNPPLYYTLTTAATQTAILAALGDIDSAHHFGFYPTPNVRDLRVSMSSIGQPKPGHLVGYVITYKNIGTDTAMNGTVILNYPGDLTYESATPTGTAGGNNAQWDFTNLMPGETRSIEAFFDVSTADTIGQQLALTGSVSSSGNTEMTPADNSIAYTSTVVSSFDPNTKEASPSAVQPAYVTGGNWFTYTIRFQNTGTDTAFNVMLKDTLDTNLNPATFELIGASSKVNASINNGRVLQFNCYNINLPDSTTNELMSHGEVSFRIKANATMATPGIIYNTAAIYFDYNPAVLTNQSTIVVGTLGTGNTAMQHASMLLFPNPASDRISVYVSSPATTGNLQLQLTDMSGKIISSYAVTANTTTQLALPAMAQGLYFARLVHGNEVLNVTKLSIAH